MGRIRVGWFVDVEHSSVIYREPVALSKFRRPDQKNSGAARCPAILGEMANCFVVCSPFTFQLSLRLRDSSCSLIFSETKSSLQPAIAKKVFSLSPPSDWRNKNNPVVQMMLPYTFVCDEDIVIRQQPPYLHYFGTRRPGVVLAGQFPLKNWPRPLSWAFEWHQSNLPLYVRQGEPLYYVSFQPPNSFDVGLEGIASNTKIRDLQRRIGGVAGMVRNSLSLADSAMQGRPETLFPEKKTESGSG